MRSFIKALFLLLMMGVLVLLLYYGGRRVYQDLSHLDEQNQQTTYELQNRIALIEQEVMQVELRSQKDVLFWFILSLASSLLFTLLLFAFKSHQIRQLTRRIEELEQRADSFSIKNLPEHE